MEVICVDDKFHEISLRLIPNRPKEGGMYTIRDWTRLPNGKTAVWLREIGNPPIPHPSGEGTFEPSFDVRRFSTLSGEPLKMDISITVKQ